MCPDRRAGLAAAATVDGYSVARAPGASYDFPMLLRQFSEVCREELRKAQRALVVAYELMRAADERALQTLFMFFQDR